MEIKLGSLDEVLKQINLLKEKNVTSTTAWSAYKTFAHCAQTIDYSMSGYPSLKPVWVRATIGKIAIRKFLKQGYMKHDLTADVAGAPQIKEQGTLKEGIEILEQSILQFQKYEGELQPHLLFGNLSKEQYNQYFALHVADHLNGFTEK